MMNGPWYTTREIAEWIVKAHREREASYTKEGNRYTLDFWEATCAVGAPAELQSLVYLGVAYGELTDWAINTTGKSPDASIHPASGLGRGMTRTEAEADMLQGYVDGLAGDPEPGQNRSGSYRHGWLNGRDDRAHNPRAFTGTLRELAETAIASDTRR